MYNLTWSLRMGSLIAGCSRAVWKEWGSVPAPFSGMPLHLITHLLKHLAGAPRTDIWATFFKSFPLYFINLGRKSYEFQKRKLRNGDVVMTVLLSASSRLIRSRRGPWTLDLWSLSIIFPLFEKWLKLKFQTIRLLMNPKESRFPCSGSLHITDLNTR